MMMMSLSLNQGERERRRTPVGVCVCSCAFACECEIVNQGTQVKGVQEEEGRKRRQKVHVRRMHGSNCLRVCVS